MRRETEISTLNSLYFVSINNFRMIPIGTTKVSTKLTVPSSSSLGNGAGASERTQLVTEKAAESRTSFCDKVCSPTLSLLP